MDNSEIARAIIELALPHLDWQQLAKSNFNVGDAEALGKKFGNFYQGFYKGVLAALTEAEQIPTIETDEARLKDVVSTKGGLVAPTKAEQIPTIETDEARLKDVVSTRGGLAAPTKATQKLAPKAKKIKLNDVLSTRGGVKGKTMKL